MSKANRRQVRARKSPSYDPNSPVYIATHEAGHAVSAVVLGIDLKWVDVRRRTLPSGAISLGFTKTAPVSYGDILGKREEVARRIMIQTLTGVAAEAAVNRRASETGGDIQDLADCRRIAIMAICQTTKHGDGFIISPQEIRQNAPRIAVLVESARQDAVRLVREHRSAIIRVAELLQVRKELTGDEVVTIVKESTS